MDLSRRRQLFEVGLLLIATLLHSVSCQTATLPEKDLSPDLDTLQNTQLKTGYDYDYFDANERHLTWYESDTRTVVVYSLDSNKVILKKGLMLGAVDGAVESVTDLVLDGDRVVISDPKARKIVAVDIQSGASTDIRHQEDLQVQNLLRIGDRWLLSDPEKLDRWVGSAANFASSIDYFRTETLDGQREFKNNGVWLGGHLTVTDDTAVNLTAYRPRIYLFDLSGSHFQEKIVFDSSEVLFRRDEDGEIVTGHPKNIDVLSMNLYNSPTYPNRVLMHLKGEGKYVYHPDRLYEYNIDSKQFTRVIKTNTNIFKLFSNRDDTFLFSTEPNVLTRLDSQEL